MAIRYRRNRSRRMRPRRRPRRNMRRRRSMKRSRASTQIVRSPSTIPDRLFTKLYFSDWTNFTTSATPRLLSIVAVFQNSLNTPRIASGQKCLYNTILTNQYYNYRVHGIAWQITISAFADAEIVAGVHPRDDLNYGSDTIPLWMSRGIPMKSIASSANSAKKMTIRGYASATKVFNITKKEFASEANYTGMMNFSDPNKMFFLVVGCGSNGANTTVAVRTKMTFFAELWNKVEMV